MGKWRALREALRALERARAAFAESHGPFLYLAAVGTAEVRGVARLLGGCVPSHGLKLAVLSCAPAFPCPSLEHCT